MYIPYKFTMLACVLSMNVVCCVMWKLSFWSALSQRWLWKLWSSSPVLSLLWRRAAYGPGGHRHILPPGLIVIWLLTVNGDLLWTPNRIVSQGAHQVATIISMVGIDPLVLISSGVLHLLHHLPMEVTHRPLNIQVHSSIKALLRHMVHIASNLLQATPLLDGIAAHLLLLHSLFPRGHMITMPSKDSRYSFARKWVQNCYLQMFS